MFVFFIAYIYIIQLLYSYCVDTITVSHTILEQESYYNREDVILNTFIDFTKYKIYKIKKELIYRKIEGVEPKFKLVWKGEDISLNCIDMKCTDIDLNNHDLITFDYDRLIAKLGGIFSFLLILYGFFSLRRGLVYFNLTVVFYGSFGFILFFRELFELFELTTRLNSEYETSIYICNTVFAFSLISCILYGYVCHLSKYLKYMTFGFINGLFLSKLIYYFLLKMISGGFYLTYFLLELITCLIFIILFIFLQNKYLMFNIVNIVIIASYGIIYGINILFGGLPFIPYLIIVKEDAEEGDLFDKLTSNNIIHLYAIFYAIILAYGIYKNYSNYKIAMNKKLKI